MTNNHYKRPPITEAVIGINFQPLIDSPSIEKVSKKFAKHYPNLQSVQNIGFSVDMVAGSTTQLPAEKGYRRSTADMTELLVLWDSSFALSQLAPYPGWDIFFERFKRDWTVWKKAVGYRNISRVGMRFINRIDIPLQDNIVRHENYFNVYPKLPDSLKSVNTYAVQTITELKDIGCRLTLNSAVVPSPLIGHLSFILDLDIGKEFVSPLSDDDIFNLLTQLRVKKNEVFEACISDEARKLF